MNRGPQPSGRNQSFLMLATPKLQCWLTNKKNVAATFNIQDEAGVNIVGAVVSATWTLPNGDQISVSGQTDSNGNVKFTQKTIRRKGYYTLMINDVTLDGFVFDLDNSVLSNSIYK